MDAFYASVEELDNPELKGKPVAVGGNRDRGVIAAANYEARKFGVKSAMSSRIAARQCPDLIFVKPNFERYKEISGKIRAIFHRYTDIIEPLALDEAYLDVTSNKMGLNSGTFIAQSIKTDIKNELNLIASAGVSYNKFLAKLASDQDKPDGLFVIKPNEAQAFIDQLAIRKFHGVGKATADKMLELQIATGKDVQNYSLEQLVQYFGKYGNYLFSVCRGIDDRPVEHDRERKSIAAEKTLNQDIFDDHSFAEIALEILEIVWNRHKKFEKNGRTLSLKIKYSDFTISSKSKTLLEQFDSFEMLVEVANQLIKEVLPLPKSVRLIGFQIGNFDGKEIEQLSLFGGSDSTNPRI
jgi:DNA polymerase-4